MITHQPDATPTTDADEFRSTATVPPAPAAGAPDAQRSGAGTVRAQRLTLAAGWSLLAICVLHTFAFAVHPWWPAWFAGPMRTEQLPLDAAVQFWGLPGGFVVPGVLFALYVISTGRRGRRVPSYVGIVLGVWALCCLWIVGPSGFVLVLAPATLLIIASIRARR
ncbi:hypothetical protein [Microlunatus sp. Y2014]|uniref:hypothetical protein n=1 Tax=Microlunatus sp. Y2014 TaxID=3418488 RepID=UPI003DA74692